MSTPKPKPPQYGTAAGYDGPPIAALMRSDSRGLYRRPSIDLQTGEVKSTAAGAVLYDEHVAATRAHLTHVGKGWELVRVTEVDNPALSA